MTHEMERSFIHGMMVPEQIARHIDRSGYWIVIQYYYNTFNVTMIAIISVPHCNHKNTSLTAADRTIAFIFFTELLPPEGYFTLAPVTLLLSWQKFNTCLHDNWRTPWFTRHDLLVCFGKPCVSFFTYHGPAIPPAKVENIFTAKHAYGISTSLL